jgi:hypothetical protein
MLLDYGRKVKKPQFTILGSFSGEMEEKGGKKSKLLCTIS